MVRTEAEVSGLRGWIHQIDYAKQMQQQNVPGTKQGWYFDVNDLQAYWTLIQGRDQVVVVGLGRPEGGEGDGVPEAEGQSSSPILEPCLRRQHAGKTLQAWRESGSPDMTAALLQQRQQSMLTDQRIEYHQTACMPDVDWTLQSPCTRCLQVNRDLSEDRSVISSCISAGLHCQPDVKRWHDNNILMLDSMLCQTSKCETGCYCILASG